MCKKGAVILSNMELEEGFKFEMFPVDGHLSIMEKDRDPLPEQDEEI